jgi:hypothetical protein
MVGVASFLEKFSMKQLSPYQINFLMAVGMAVTAIPALWLKPERPYGQVRSRK